MNFNPNVPEPYSESWRESYRANEDDFPRLSTYQSPNGSPIPFILGKNDFSGGQSVDTSEYPYFGFWSNNSLNEKPQEITISGFIRGKNYIANRNELIVALRKKNERRRTRLFRPSALGTICRCGYGLENWRRRRKSG